jgi:hypothetical protein
MSGCLYRPGRIGIGGLASRDFVGAVTASAEVRIRDGGRDGGRG